VFQYAVNMQSISISGEIDPSDLLAVLIHPPSPSP